MATLAEQIRERLRLHVDAARDAVGTAWAEEAQARNPAPRFAIRYADGSVIVPLIPWILSTGARPHNIPHAFGYPPPFGIGGRFSGMFHPGYTHPTHFVQAARDSARVKDAIQDFPGLLFHP